MAEITFTCPQCGRSYQFASHLGGKRGRCNSCQAVFRIPEAVEAPISPAAKPAPTPADPGKIAFNCPSCGRGYRLDGKLAGKQGRCTACRGIFTIPTISTSPATAAPPPWPEEQRPGADPPSRPQTRPDSSWMAPPATRGARAAGPAAAVAAGDSGWWELDSSESIPATMARPSAGRRRPGKAVAAATAVEPGEWAEVEDDAPAAIARPVPAGRPKWIIPASIAGAVVAGGIAFAVTSALVSGGGRPAPPPVADQPEEEPEATPPPAVAKVEEPGPSPAPEPRPAGPAEQHREAVDAITIAYNAVADGYARIRDPRSVADGNAAVSRAVAELRSASRRGKGLPPLPTAARQALIRESGASLLQALDRVLDELRRLETTPGLRSEFGPMIESYTRVRDGIRREVDRA